MDTVFISDLRIDTIVGIYDWERRMQQTVSLDIEMASDNRKAAATDAIEDALDYKAVAKRLIQYVGDQSFKLVETLAERCAGVILTEFDIDWIRVTLHKPGAVTGSKSVGVVIERSRHD